MDDTMTCRHRGGASAPVWAPERASFGPKAPAIAMVGRPWQAKARMGPRGAPWQRDRGSARHREAPSLRPPGRTKTRRQGAPPPQDQPKLTRKPRGRPLAARLRQRFAKKHSTGDAPGRTSPVLLSGGFACLWRPPLGLADDLQRLRGKSGDDAWLRGEAGEDVGEPAGGDVPFFECASAAEGGCAEGVAEFGVGTPGA